MRNSNVQQETIQQLMLVGWTFTQTLTPVLMKLSGSSRLRLYNEKSGVVRPFYSLPHRLESKLTLTSRPTASTMSCVVCKLNVSTRLGTFVPEERKLQGCESYMERKFLEHLLMRSESSTGAKVPWNESSWTFRSRWANVPRNESSLYGLFAAGNESAEEWKGQLPSLKLDGTTERPMEQQLANIYGKTAHSRSLITR